MTQVVKFFGWLVMGIGATLVVFSYITIGFVYGMDHLTTLVASNPVGTALSVLALVPGALLYGVGVLMEKWSQKANAKRALDSPETTTRGAASQRQTQDDES